MSTLKFFTARQINLTATNSEVTFGGEEPISEKLLTPIHTATAKPVAKLIDDLLDEDGGDFLRKILPQHTDPTAVFLYAKNDKGLFAAQTVRVIQL